MAKDTSLAETAVAVLSTLFPDPASASSYGFDAGHRYHRIWHEQHGQRSVAFFIEPETGGIYKAAGWGKPAPKVRFTVQTAEELEELLTEKADPYSRWLYLR